LRSVRFSIVPARSEVLMEHVVEMLNIRKEFPGIVANDQISIDLRKGEILALLGENGAGKSTLMSILFGLYRPDEGKIKIRGKDVQITNPTRASDLGIGMVHQHFKLVHNFTITENIVLGMEPKKGISLDLTSAASRIRELSRHYGLNVDPDAVIEDVSVGMQQRVEILKMLYRDAEVLIFDEPTSVLTPQEIQDLMEIMRNLIREGKSIILITHKLKEIKAIADRCTVIRRGKVIGTVEVQSTSESEMARMMVGREVSFSVDKEKQEPGEVILEIENLSVRSSPSVLGVKNFSLKVRAGEIVGIAGVDGNGQTELVEALTGLRSIESGHILLKGRDISADRIHQRIQAGIAHIPEDRQKRGLVLDYSVEDNLVLETHSNKPFALHGFLQRKPIRNHAKKVMKDFDVRAGEGAVTRARSLSGGNQQKAIVGREIDLNPELLIAVQPTRGLDVGSIEYIHRRLVEQRDKGKAVLLVSLELDEILDLSDRIAIISRGELAGIVNADETDKNEVGLMMAGIKQGESA
jgi:general nucleoside transport system ATP-binding protein